MGRETRLTPDVEDRICELVRQGNYLSTAARAAGVGYATVKTWMSRGTQEGDEHELHRAFRAAVQRAERESEQELVAMVRNHAKEDWRAAIALLERRAPKRWSKNSNVKVDGKIEHKGLGEFLSTAFGDDPKTE